MLNDGSTIAIVVGGLVTVVTGFFAIAKVMLSQASGDREADRKERAQLALAIKDMAKSSARVADATVKGAAEARERNGHLADMVKEAKEQTINAISIVKEQHVEHQHVQTEKVEKVITVKQ